MVIISFNIVGTFVYNDFPLTYYFNTIKEALFFIRNNSIEILNYSHFNQGIKRNCKLALSIIEPDDKDEFFQWDFLVNCENIREFKDLCKLNREEFESIYIDRQRTKSINDILE